MRAAHVLRQIKHAYRAFGNRLRKHPIVSITLSLLVVGGVALFIGVKFHQPITTVVTNIANPEPPKERRAIDGVLVPLGHANPWLVSVMIENAKDAQPISGIDTAVLVYESLVEATITRFMAVYALDETTITNDEPIGPVRSVRPYYVTWATELGAMLAHVGGSPDALNRIKARGMLTLNEYSNGQYFVRDRERYAPHNIYTANTLLQRAAMAKLPDTSLEQWSKNLPAWQFKDDTELTARGATDAITIGYPGAYAVSWEYNKDENVYTRIQWGGLDTLSNGIAMKAKNIAVIVQRMAILDEIGRKQFTTEGSGKAYLFRDGTALVGTWQKDSPSARMRLFDEQGIEMQFNAGVTWIEIVPTTAPITY